MGFPHIETETMNIDDGSNYINNVEMLARAWHIRDTE